MIDTSKNFSIHIMQIKPAETDLILTAIEARHALHGLAAAQECAP